MENKLFYSPKEEHLAIVYSERHGQARFKRFIDETERVWLGPKAITQLYVLKERYLGARTAHIFLSDVLTADRVHLELELKVFYRVDPRKAAAANLVQVINMPDAGFESIVKTNTEEKVRNDVFLRFTEAELFSLRGRKNVRTALSSLISERVSGFGITIDPRFGVAIMNMQPNAIYYRAMQEESAAIAQGNAVLKRVAPSLQNLSLEQALQALYTHLASTITKTGTIPEHVYAYQNVGEIPMQNIDAPIGNVTEGPSLPPPASPRKPKQEHQYPIAAD